MQSRQNDHVVRIFIGSGDASTLERKTLIHSIKRHTSRELEIWHYNGTNNTIENETGEQRPCPKKPALAMHHRYATEFSLFRFYIPQLCNFQGKALYLDSDMIVFSDIGELFDISLDGFDFAACPNAYPAIAPNRWALSTMLIDCGVCRFDLDKIFHQMQQRQYSYVEFAQMGQRARNVLTYRIKELSKVWNHFDKMDDETNLIHYTDLDRQPWKYRYHQYGEAWFEFFAEAVRSGSITDQEIKTAIERKFVRADIMKGNRGDDTAIERAAGMLHALRLKLRDIKRKTERMITGANV